MLKNIDKILKGIYNNRVLSSKALYRGIAQLVEQRSPKPRAEGSSPSTPAKVIIGTRFRYVVFADIAQLAVHILGKDEVTSSSLVISSIFLIEHRLRHALSNLIFEEDKFFNKSFL